MTTTATHRFFVYGSLAPGRSNHHMLAGVSGTWESAVVTGRLVALGWGAAAGYSAIVLDGGDAVQGYLFSADRLHEHWERLDA